MAQDYDKIIKENFANSVPALAKTLLNIDIPRSEKVPLRLQYTIEREPDFLIVVRHDNKDEDFVLQIEFQTHEERKKMLYRLMLYRVLLLQKMNLPVRQFVFYIGEEEIQNTVQYEDETMRFLYKQIRFKDIPYEVFLNSDRPEEVIFAILTDWKQQEPEIVVRDIIVRLKTMVPIPLKLQQLVRQLEIISKLRNLQETVDKIIRTMPIRYDLQTDIRFVQGKEIGTELGTKLGKEEMKQEFIITFYKFNMPIARIMELTKEKEAYIKKVIATYEKNLPKN